MYRENFKGTSDSALPDIIHDKLKSLVKDTENISDGSLRKIRILYNMLKQTFQSESNDVTEVTKKKNKNKKPKTDPQNGDAKENGGTSDVTKESKEKKPVGKKEKEDEGTKSDVKQENAKKTKGPKRYVVFVGNLPLDIDREKVGVDFFYDDTILLALLYVLDFLLNFLDILCGNDNYILLNKIILASLF